MMETTPHACGVDDTARPSSLTNEHAFGVDDAPYPFPSPVPGLGHFNQALMGHSCQAPKDLMDNYGTHKVSKVRTWLARHPRYHVHFTPTSGSWLNLVERLFAEVTERCVRRGSHTAVRQLEEAMLAYLDQRNRNPKPFVWKADADLILGKVERLCQRISNSGH
jgi:transposase